MERIPQISIEGAKVPILNGPVVDRLPPPVVERTGAPRLTIPRPVVEVPRPVIEYPTISLPLAPPKVGTPSVPQRPREANKEESAGRSRSLPETPTPPPAPAPPPIPPIPQTAPVPSGSPQLPVATEGTISLAGYPVKLPTPTEITQASATAVVGTSVTLVTAMIFNQARRAAGEAISKAVRNKFKVRLRTVKPVIHMIYEDGGITVMEYSSEGVKTLATHVDNPEQFLRDTIETDELYEADHKIVIDEPIRERFSREGAKRFNYFAPPKKLARRLAARVSLG